MLHVPLIFEGIVGIDAEGDERLLDGLSGSFVRDLANFGLRHHDAPQ